MRWLLPLAVLAAGPAAAQGIGPALTLTTSPVPVPPAEQGLPTVVARRWVKVLDGATPVEGLTFDTRGNILFCDVAGDRVMRVAPDGRVSVLFHRAGLSPSGIAVGADGRMVVATGDTTGGDTAADDAAGWRGVVPRTAGYLPNDVVRDSSGGFYFTDFKGTPGEPTGGVYHVASGQQAVGSALTGLVLPDGIALDVERQILWVTEFGQNRLLRIELETPTKAKPLRINPVYQFIGPAPDGVRVDREGRAYVALNGQGRVLIFSRAGLPIGQVLLPGRDEGRYLNSTSLALSPDGREVVIIASDGERGGGAAIFRASLTQGTAPPAR